MMKIIKSFLSKKSFDTEYDDTLRSDTEWVIKVFNSCTTRSHYEIARRITKLWDIKSEYYDMWAIDSDFHKTEIVLYRNMIDEACDSARKRVFMPL